ncbi:MAG: 4-hydroxy-3-methylbut-2-enyl diphosphate reductase [Treponema sp.]|nr:4-hydroxy-3-methylbut-2-enyl diphosphate reductase [Candidatus Treponema equifaecale]
MKIVRADTMGFCAGVRRAVMIADKALSENKSGQVYTFGPLIHNPEALKKFEERGLKVLGEDDISALKTEDTVVVRAHGVAPEVMEKLEKTGATILNGTCPIVQVNQIKCANFAREGVQIFFTGDKDHGEVIGIEGAGRKAAFEAGTEYNFNLIKNLQEAENLVSSIDTSRPVSLFSQTTFSIKVFDEISSYLKEKLPEIEIVKSICPATHERQESLVELCKKVEGVIVIGGKNSANTNRLFATAQRLCKKATLIENAEEIPQEFFELEKVGLTAGASTPDDVIEEVEKKLLSKKN